MPTFHSISGEPVLEGKYHLECRLGQGGMGVVYKGRHAYLKTLHAIKIILPDLVGNDPQLVQRFRQEALAAAAIRHQNVVGVSDYGVAQGTMPFLVMEYVEGESLHDLLEREKTLSPEKALELMTAIARGIGVAHKQGIVHRDLKPLNIMIQNDKHSMSEAVKILDFGLAKIKSGELLGSFIQAQTTGLMGSPFYMAPEQWADEEPDATSDIYSLGIMFFQMLAGDVPFKGNSIPAIMKKHVSDLPPTFAEMGVFIKPQLEQAVRHALAKNRRDRTPTVEQFIEELTAAIKSDEQEQDSQKTLINTQNPIPDTGSYLQVLTIPPQSKVFIDNIPAGESREDGWLMLEGLRTGRHHIRVTREGFLDWENEFESDGNPKELVAQLKEDTGAIPMPARETVPSFRHSLQNTPKNLGETQNYQNSGQMQNSQNFPNQTQQTNLKTDEEPGIYVDSQPPRPPFFSPFILSIIGIFGLLTLGIISISGAYMMGWIGSATPVPTQAKTPSPTPTPYKNEREEIPGGTFTMGNNRGRDNEKPEHPETVETFFMDKTEVTNAEYYQFIAETGYQAPAHFVNGKPVPGKEMYPVNFVSHKDAEAFAQWRAKRDNLEWRLPTEKEWEYAARNGSRDNLYPWGDKFEEGMAVIDRENGNQLAVGSKKGDNIWGVQDLIGNVYEWTSSEAWLYPGSPGVVKETKEKSYMVRGGDASSQTEGPFAITSTLRADVLESEANKGIGFRLVYTK
ncbi:MAG: bifunctional serine/threonine-protein kinase/formylglycine-generating enzyme family protein [Pyrinomonadaceae bacterium]